MVVSGCDISYLCLNPQELTRQCPEAIRKTKSQKLNTKMPGTGTRKLGGMMTAVFKSELQENLN